MLPELPQGNDCSERTCYFGIAHVDTPKGDLNSDGMVSGPLTTVITGSEVYPWGTTEQYPNADANEGHFYMECSNKGICDRKSGECECFDGYEGTACVRASCPNDCSGHGTCETIKELAELKGYDTNAGDVATTTPVGATESVATCTDPNGGSTCPAMTQAAANAASKSLETLCTSAVDSSGNTCVFSYKVAHHNFDLAIEESYSYDLWDQDKTMGCKCDPVYYGADCSLKKCKYGVDPLFYDSNDGRIYQTSIVNIGNKDRAGAIGGTFNIVFYDVFGEKYTTKAIDATAKTTSSLKVQEALEALPNGVIARTHNDVTFEAGAGDTASQGKTSAVQVSMQKEKGAIAKSGTIGAGLEGGTPGESGTRTTVNADGSNNLVGTDGGVGFGTWGNPTSDAADPVGYGPQFTITFSTNPGVLKTIELDTRQVTNPGVTGCWVAKDRQGQFSSRYSTNVGRVNTLRYGSKLLYTSTDWRTTVPQDTLVKIGGQETIVTAVQSSVITLHDPFLGTSILPHLVDTKIIGTAFSREDSITTVNKLALTTGGAGKVTAATVPDILGGAKLYINGCPFTTPSSPLEGGGKIYADDGGGTALADDAASIHVATGSDCSADTFTSTTLYRRSDQTTNQNLYKTSGDTGALATVGVCASRGHSVLYACEAGDTVESIAVDATDPVARVATLTTTATSTAVATDQIFVNGVGPLTVGTVADKAVPLDVASSYWFEDGGAATATIFAAQKVKTQTEVAAGSIMILDGRRYKVAATAAGKAGGSDAAGGKITLTETYAGGQLLEVCEDCIVSATAATPAILSAVELLGVAAGDQLAVSGSVHKNLFQTVQALAADKLTVTPQKGSLIGKPDYLTDVGGTPLTGTDRLSLYKALNTGIISPILVTESRTGVTYQYVSQCANRGSCDGSTGLCTCFKGFSNDNCDTQNMLAI
jgi:hypothetical protein